MFTRGDKEIDRFKALEIFAPYCRKVEGMDAYDAKIHLEESFDRVEANSGLTRNQNRTYSFTHLALQEFLTIAYIMDNVQDDHNAAIKPYLKEVRYENVIRLYIGLLSIKGNKGIANRIVENILQEQNEPENWLLAGDSLLDIHKQLREEKIQNLAVSKMKEIIYRQSSGFPHHERKESDVFLLFLRNNVENHFLFAIHKLLSENPVQIHNSKWNVLT